jgi:hypothetical protein
MTMHAKDAARLLAGVPYRNRLSVGRMMMPKGIHRSRVARLQELYWFMMPTAKSLVALKPERVAEWVRKDIGDAWLADEIDRVNTMDIAYVEKCHQLYELLEQRIAALEKIAVTGEVIDHA